MRLLAVTTRVPTPDRDAGSRRFEWLLRAMARRHTIDLAIRGKVGGLSPAGEDAYREALAASGVRVLPRGRRVAERALARSRYDAVLFEGYVRTRRCLRLARALQPWAHILVDSVDVCFARQAAAAEVGLLPAADVARTRVEELAVYRSADAIIAATAIDRDVLLAEGGMPPAVVLPCVYPSRPRAPGPRPPEVLFVGGFLHAPNVDGVRWFVEEVWPQVRRGQPDAVFTVVGSHVTDEVKRLGEAPGVRVEGYVPEIGPYLDRAAVSVAPLRFGAGMKGKVNEAMASGVPVVSTTYGVQGLDAVSGVHAFVADDAGGFADAVLRLLSDPCLQEAMGMAGQERNAAVCAPESVEEVLARLLEGCAPKPVPLSARARRSLCRLATLLR